MSIAIAAIIENQIGDFLLHLRDSNASALKNQWCLICGAVELKEKPLRAAVREIEEETGLSPLSIKYLVSIDFNNTKFYVFHAIIQGYLKDLKLGEGTAFKLENGINTKKFIEDLNYSNPFLDILNDFLTNTFRNTR